MLSRSIVEPPHVKYVANIYSESVPKIGRGNVFQKHTGRKENEAKFK